MTTWEMNYVCKNCISGNMTPAITVFHSRNTMPDTLKFPSHSVISTSIQAAYLFHVTVGEDHA